MKKIKFFIFIKHLLCTFFTKIKYFFKSKDSYSYFCYFCKIETRHI